MTDSDTKNKQDIYKNVLVQWRWRRQTKYRTEKDEYSEHKNMGLNHVFLFILITAFVGLRKPRSLVPVSLVV